MKEVIMMSLSTQPKRVKGGNMRVSSKKLMVSLIFGCVAVLFCSGLVYAQDTLVTGQELWTYGHHGYNRDDRADDVYYDAATNQVYLCGYEKTTSSRYKWVVCCLNATTGAQIWRNESGGGSWDDYCRAYAVIVGLDGKVYAAGNYYDDSPNRDQQMHIRKYNPTTGTVIHSWTYDWSTSAYDDYLYDIEYGWDHKIYVCGRNQSGSYYRACVVQLDTNLSYSTDVFWTYYVVGGNSIFRSIKPCQAQNCIYVGGSAYVSAHANMDFYVVKLSTGMATLGEFFYDAGYGNNECLDIALPYSGTGVYACGYAVGFGTGDNYIVMDIPASCTAPADYIYTKDGTASGEDRAHEIEVSTSNYTYSCGWLTNTGQNKDFTVVSTSSSGLRWMYTLDGVDHLADYAYDLEVNAARTRVFTTGFVWDIIDGNEEDLIVKKHSLAGAAYWTYYYDYDGDERGFAIDVASDGNVYVAGKYEDYSYSDFFGLALNQNFVPTVPTLISPADAGYLNDTSVAFIWSSCIDIETSVSGYYLYYSMDPALATYDSVWSTDTIQTVVLTDTTWYWAVKAKDSEGGFSDFSATWDFQFDLTAPVAPVLTSPINDAYEFDTTVTFSWQAVTFLREVPSPVTYVIQVDTNSGFASLVALDTIASITVDLDLPLEEYYYYWRVKAFDAAENQGPYSGYETFMVDLNDPLIDGTYHSPEWWPGPFDVFSQVTDTWGVDEVVLHYKRPEDPAFFPDTMSEGSDDWYKGEIPALTTAYDTVKYYIWARDNAGKESRDPATGYHTFEPTHAVEENPGTVNVFAFNVKGNLIKGKAIFNLSLPKNSSVTLEIYDASGRLVATPATGMKSAGNHTITWTPKANGIYFYTLTSSYGRKVGKILNIK